MGVGADRTLKQPREDIVATDRPDALLSLEDDNWPARALIMRLALELYGASLIGNAPTGIRELRARMTNPQPGDLVMELSTAYQVKRGRVPIEGLGYLLETREEWWHTDEEWASQREDWGDPRPTDVVSYVQYGPAAADVCRWVNYTLIVVPT